MGWVTHVRWYTPVENYLRYRIMERKKSGGAAAAVGNHLPRSVQPFFSAFTFFFFFPPFFSASFSPSPFPPFSLYWQVIITSINGGARSIFTRSLSLFLFRFVGNLSRLRRERRRRRNRREGRTNVARCVIRALTVSLFEGYSRR